jgi:hypothetical protein
MLVAAGSASFGADVQPIIIGTTTAPGTGGATFSSSGLAAVDPAGNVAAIGNLSGTGVVTTNNQGIWSGQPGALTLVARKGDQVPTLGAGVTYSSFFGPNINNNGTLIFRAAATGTGVTAANDGLLVHGTAAGVSVIARDGQQAAGAPAGVVYGNLNDTSNVSVNYQPVISMTGGIAFKSPLAGTGVTATVNDMGLWAGTTASNFTMVARTGNVAPGAGAATFSNFAKPVINASGKIATAGTLTGSGVTTLNDRGIWAGTAANGLSLVAREGNVVPGTGGATFVDFFVPGINNSGNVGFAALLEGTGVTPTNDRGLYFGTSLGTLTQVAREGDAAPGLTGVNLGQINLPTLNPVDQFGFPSFLTGTGVTTANDTALWIGDTGGLDLIAREGSAAPGTGGAMFGSFQTTTPAMNGLGQLAFVAALTGPGVTNGANDRALYFFDPEDGLTILARSGDTVPIDGVSRTYADMFITSGTQTSGTQDGEVMGLNDLGQITVFSLNGDSYLITVPEPGSLALLGLGALACLARRRRSARA